MLEEKKDAGDKKKAKSKSKKKKSKKELGDCKRLYSVWAAIHTIKEVKSKKK